MGNLGNPVITRTGLNQFWYKYWYSDKNYTQTLHQNKFFELFIMLFLDYGLTFKYNTFSHPYWFNIKQFRLLNYQNLFHLYFRRYYYTNEALTIEHSYLLRNKTGEYFPMRIWFFRFNTWLIITVQWFKPIKHRLKYRKGKNLTSASAINIIRPKFKTYFLRLKYLLIFFLKKQSTYFFKKYVF